MSETPGKYSGIIKARNSGKPKSQKAGKTASKETSEPANQKTSKPVNDPEVNLCVRIPKSQRQWFAAQAKMNGTSMTEVIKRALAAEFGLPPDR